MTRLLMIAALCILGCAWAQVARADSVAGHYTITLTDWDPCPGTATNPCQTFNFIPNPSDVDTSDYQDTFCPGLEFCTDPKVGLQGGGKSTPEDGEFSFSSGPGTETLDFQNTGPEINEVLIDLTSNDGQPNPDQEGALFSCSGGTLFNSCGFNDDGLGILFYNNPDLPLGTGIATATPEPGQWIILLLAFAGIIVARARKGSASSSFARTPR